MLSQSDTPTLNEWLALIDHDPLEAKQLVTSLRAQVERQGLMADPALAFSLLDYERARNLLGTAAQDARQTADIRQRVTLGHAARAAYRSRDEWVAVIQADPLFAQALCGELERKQALLGVSAPPPLEHTIAAYHAAVAEQRSDR